MKAAILSSVRRTPGAFLQMEDVPRPELEAGHVLLQVVACGVCRTDLHIVEGDLPQRKQRLIPGHQISLSAIAGFSLVRMANVYMSLYGRIRLDLRRERAEINSEERLVPNTRYSG